MHIHFIGIGGVSMKALAEFSYYIGNIVTGSDDNYSIALKHLEEIGIICYLGDREDVIIEADLIVISNAISDTNIDYYYAKKHNKVIVDRGEFLSWISCMTNESISVAGTHGKSTSSALLIDILDNLKYKIIGHVGADYIDRKSNLVFSGYDFFVSEACEYCENFLKLKTDYLLILNIEYDHPDYYKDFISLQNAFKKLMLKTKKIIVIEYDAYLLLSIEDTVHNSKIVTFGDDSKSNYYYANISYSNLQMSFDIYKDSKFYCNYKTRLLGEHMARNITGVIALLDNALNLKYNYKSQVSDFLGLKRRFECLGMTSNNVKVVIDYAHHPSEIEKTIAVAKKMCKGELFVVFEPHTTSRTKGLFKEFIRCFNEADYLILLKTFKAREYSSFGVDSNILFDAIRKDEKVYFDEFSECEDYLIKKTAPNDLILILGAGDVYNIGYDLINT